MSKRIIHTDKAPAPIGPYSQAVVAGNMLFVSGQVAIIPATGDLATGDIVTETHQVMKNIGAILDAAGFHFSDIVKTSIFLSDMGLFASVNEVYGSYFTSDFPARETVAVKTLPKNVNVEITVTAIAVA
ncbi:MAG TPA: RidA family protein [Dinghuibacter sp.]|uniref:RidA family protein n=1 Tax=Dinghuibacter sp. TaxID=2024697 RepID=UPI002C4F06DC|nr:RidA family protein [Dinghuibacter sp.]HTJ11225.1 RidA family protein [Dinghuibacter sp.]